MISDPGRQIDRACVNENPDNISVGIPIMTRPTPIMDWQMEQMTTKSKISAFSFISILIVFL
jgi:hypothetical protein